MASIQFVRISQVIARPGGKKQSKKINLIFLQSELDAAENGFSLMRHEVQLSSSRARASHILSAFR